MKKFDTKVNEILKESRGSVVSLFDLKIDPTVYKGTYRWGGKGGMDTIETEKGYTRRVFRDENIVSLDDEKKMNKQEVEYVESGYPDFAFAITVNGKKTGWYDELLANKVSKYKK